MRALLLLPFPFLVACALPPRVDDRTTPEQAYRTFQGAIARRQIEREWDAMSPGLKARLGMKSRGDWADARAIALDQGHIVVRGICRSRVDGAPKELPDGRVELPLRFPFGIEGRVWMRRIAKVRIWADGELDPRVQETLPALEIAAGEPGFLVVVPPEVMREFHLPPEGSWDPSAPWVRIEAALLWYLDDFSIGEENPGTVRDEVESGRKEP